VCSSSSGDSYVETGGGPLKGMQQGSCVYFFVWRLVLGNWRRTSEGDAAEELCVVCRLAIGTWKREESFRRGCSRGAV
jgi:tetrahydromethanopterin S-methyltransferase subunit E